MSKSSKSSTCCNTVYPCGCGFNQFPQSDEELRDLNISIKREDLTDLRDENTSLKEENAKLKKQNKKLLESPFWQ